MLNKFLDTAGYISIRLKKTKSQHLVTKLEVNGFEGLFLLDTGASNSCIRLDKENDFLLIGKKAPCNLAEQEAKNWKLNQLLEATSATKEVLS